MRTTPKQAQILYLVESTPGITTAEIHRRIGKFYAHGHHKFTYESVSRMIKAGRLKSGAPANGLRGGGLYLPGPIEAAKIGE